MSTLGPRITQRCPSCPSTGLLGSPERLLGIDRNNCSASSGAGKYIDMSARHRPEHNFYSGNAPLHDRKAAAAARAAKPTTEPT